MKLIFQKGRYEALNKRNYADRGRKDEDDEDDDQCDQTDRFLIQYWPFTTTMKICPMA